MTTSKDMFREHFAIRDAFIENEPKACRIEFRVGNQTFRIGPDYCEDAEHAEWFISMFCKALHKLRPAHEPQPAALNELLDAIDEEINNIDLVAGVQPNRELLMRCFRAIEKLGAAHEPEATDEDHVCGVCEGTQRGVCNCKPAQPPGEQFTDCIFDGPPPSGFESWNAWVAEPTKRNVTIRATTEQSSVVQPPGVQFADCGCVIVDGVPRHHYCRSVSDLNRTLKHFIGQLLAVASKHEQCAKDLQFMELARQAALEEWAQPPGPSECQKCKRREESLRLEWSDREGIYHESEFYSAVMHCSLDHSYDRTSDGVPSGMPDEYRLAFAPIVAKHLSAIEPNWPHKTVYMSDEQTAAFEADLKAAQDRVADPTKCEGNT